MPELYAAATIAVCRAGATTVAELAAAGVPSVLVPLPGAPGDHQTRNAEALVAAGAAVLVPDAECTGARLAAELDAAARRPRPPGDHVRRRPARWPAPTPPTGRRRALVDAMLAASPPRAGPQPHPSGPCPRRRDRSP